MGEVRTQVEQVMKLHPDLCFIGYSPAFANTRTGCRQELTSDSSVRVIGRCVAFILSSLTSSQRINGGSTGNSYTLKHVAEYSIGEYVCNGQMIAAMLIAGYRIKSSDRGVNVQFNVSRRSVRDAMKKTGRYAM